MTESKKKLKKIYIFTLLAILLIILASVGYIYVVSQTFTQLVHETPEKISPSEITVEVSDPGVISAEIECVQDSGGEYDYYLRVRPISAGRSNVSYMIKEDGGAVSNHLKIVCTELKTLYEDDELMFNGQEALFPMLALILLSVLVCFVISFIIKFREGDFSYSMAVLGGLILYILGSLLIMIIYLIEQGIPEEQIVKEDKSVNTLQNFEYSKKVIVEHGGDIKKCIAFSTTNYHVFRGYTLAQRVSLMVHGLSARTKPYFYPNAFVREFIGLLYEQKGKHILFLVLVIAYLLLYDLALLIL